MGIIGNREVQEILPKAMTDLFNECIKVYPTGSFRNRISCIERWGRGF